MNPLKWIFELVDRVSPRSKQIAVSLRETRGGLDEVRESIQPVERGFEGFMAKTARILKSLGSIAFAIIAVARAAAFLGGLGFFKEIPKVFAAFRSSGARGGFSEMGSALDRIGGRFLDRIGLAKSSMGQLGNRLGAFASNIGERLNAMKPAAVNALKIGAGLAVAGLAAYGLFRAFSSVLRVSLQIGEAIAEWTQRFGRAVLEARLFRERTTFGLTLLTGSQSGAEAVLNQARELSQFLGTDLRQTVGGIQELMSKGFSARGAGTIFQALADLQTVSAEPIDTGRVVLAISQIRQAGVLQGDELRQLQESGLPLEHVWERIAEQMGVSVQQVQRMRGQIPAATAIQGILRGISDTTGRPIGGAAREFSMTLPGLLQRLQNAPTAIFDAIAARGDGAFGNLRDILAEVATLLDPRSAGFQRFVEMAASGVDVLVEGLRTAWEFGKVFFEGLAEGFGASPNATGQDALQALRDWLVDFRQNDEAIQTVRDLGSALAVVARAVAALGAIFGPSIVRMTVMVHGGFALMLESIARFQLLIMQAPQWGRDLVQGLINGITSMFEPLRTAASTLASLIPTTVSNVLALHSPSRVMMQIGEMTGAGFAIGLDGSMPDLGNFEAPRFNGSGGGAAGGAGARAINLSFEITVNGGDSDGIVNSIRRLLIPELTATLEGINAEEGVA